MIPGINPRELQKMMKKMGVAEEALPAEEVIIRLPDKDLVFASPSVTRVKMMGQESYQIQGEPEERARNAVPEISDDDVKTVVEQTGASAEAARKAIMDADGDLAAAILALNGE